MHLKKYFRFEKQKGTTSILIYYKELNVAVLTYF